jgi:CarD family transcriptional regulator
MKFAVGDKVMHPQHGPGQIERLEHRELVEGFEHYYVVKMLINGSTMYIPVRQMDELGVRPVMSQSKLARVFDTLGAVPRRLSKDFKVRQAKIRDKIATARPIKLAEAVRDLTGRTRSSHLTEVDRRLLDRCRELLAAEVALATEIDVVNAHETLDDALREENEEGSRTPEPAKVANTVRAA